MGKCLTIALLGVSLIGCNGLDRLLNGPQQSRNGDYEPAIPSQPVKRVEPFAEFEGYNDRGEWLFIIHWTGSILDNTGMLDSEVRKMNIPEFFDNGR